MYPAIEGCKWHISGNTPDVDIRCDWNDWPRQLPGSHAQSHSGDLHRSLAKFTAAGLEYLTEVIEVPNDDLRWITLNRDNAFVDVDTPMMMDWMTNVSWIPGRDLHWNAKQMTALEMPKTKRQKRALRNALHGHGHRIFVEHADMV